MASTPRANGMVLSAPEQAPAVPALLTGWGGGTRVRASVVRPGDLAGLREALVLAERGAIARGMGRSYGDAAQLAEGLVLDTTALKAFELDAVRGTITAQAGTTLGELLQAIVPAGWMLPVLPGTQHVTVGGAIAGDIHGKNHGQAGTFGSHVEELSLLSPTGELIELAPGAPDGLFEATLGGMGLTGVIVAARVRLRAVSGALLSVDTDRVASLEAALGALRAPGGPYRVAWLDLLGRRPVRGVVTRAKHLDRGGGSATVRARATVPARWRWGSLRPSAVRAFNAFRYASHPRRARGCPESLGSHMFPLDVLEAWPRLYGRRGMIQYQVVVPTGSERVLEVVIERLRRCRVPCYLAVLKDFGPANGAPLSFPIEGWTLALDLPRAADGLGPLLDALDELVAEAGGRVYLSKDARLRPGAFAAMYPRLEEWRAARDHVDPERVWCSDLARRIGLL